MWSAPLRQRHRQLFTLATAAVLSPSPLSKKQDRDVGSCCAASSSGSRKRFKHREPVACEQVWEAFPELRAGAWKLDVRRLPELTGISKSPARGAGGDEKAEPESPASTALGQVVGVLQRFFEGVSPDVPKALAGLFMLSLADVAKSPFLKETPSAADELVETNREICKEAAKYMRIASASYGPLLVNPVMFPDSQELRAAMPLGVEAAMRAHAGLHRSDIRVLCYQEQATWLQPAHFVVYDSSARELIIAVRGTLSLEDVVTDLGAGEVPFFAGGVAHSSILQSAGNIMRLIAPQLERVASDVDKVTFTGHSLGAASAAYLCWLFAELLAQPEDSNKLANNEPLQLRCYAFGCPGVCTAEVAHHAGNIMSFSNRLDIVPRLNFGSMVELHNRAIEAVDASAGSSGSPKQMASSATPRTKLYPAGRNFLLSADGTCVEVDPEEVAPFIWLGGGSRLVIDHLPPQYEATLNAAACRSDAS